MYKLEYDKNGNPIPYDFIDMTGEDLKENLVDSFSESKTRKDIYYGYTKYCNDLLVLINECVTQWIDGSFTTIKTDPNDIDIVNWASAERINQLGTALIPFDTRTSQGQVKIDYKVDGYIIPNLDAARPDLSRYYKQNFDYWSKWWGHDRKNNVKGIIKIRLENKAAKK